MTGLIVAALWIAPPQGFHLADEASLVLAPEEGAPPWRSPIFAPLCTLGVGAVMAITGAVLWIGASGDAADLRARYDKGVVMRSTDADLAASAATRGRLGSSLLAAGVVVGAGGGVWLYVAGKRSEQMLGLRVEF